MSRFRCRYRDGAPGEEFDADSDMGTWTENVVCQPNSRMAIPTGGDSLIPDYDVPGMIRDWFAAHPPVTDIAPPPAVNDRSFASRVADIMDALPAAPGFAPVAAGECVWCRITKKLAPWAGLVAVGLLVAWLARKLFR